MKGGNKMDYDAVLQFIQTVGFPIAVCCYLLWKSDSDAEKHKAEVDQLSNAINNNTLVMQKLLDKMGVI